MDVKKTVISKDNMGWDTYMREWHTGINDIYTVLIKEAANCDRYASDVLFDINQISSALSFPNIDGREFWIGFRQLGVDHKNAIMSKLEEPEVYGKDIYRKIYYVRFEIDADYEPDFERGSAFGTVEFGEITL